MDPRLLNTLRYELDRYVAAGEPEQERHRAKLARCVDELLAQPVAPGEVLVRRWLEELGPALAERRLPASYVQLLRELERAPRGQGNGPVAPRSAVEEARELLRGRALVLIGGIPRPDHQESLRAAFELSEVVWPPTSETKPTLSVLEPHIARADVAAVVLLIRWIRHALNDVADLCARHGKPLIRAPGGYNVNQIAQLLVDR
jgi:hypothetical protein